MTVSRQYMRLQSCLLSCLQPAVEAYLGSYASHCGNQTPSGECNADLSASADVLGLRHECAMF